MKIKPDNTEALYVLRCDVQISGSINTTAREALMNEIHKLLFLITLGKLEGCGLPMWCCCCGQQAELMNRHEQGQQSLRQVKSREPA